MNCRWKVVVQNKTDTPIADMRINYSLLDFGAQAHIKKVAPNGSVVLNHASYTEKCPGMAQVKPKASVKKCKMGALTTPEECLKYIIVK